jgi:hypothetical protein
VITVETKEIAKVLGGIAIGKLEDKYIPYSYSFAGVDLVRTGLGVAQIAAAAYFERKVSGVAKDVLDLVGVAGAQLLVDQIARMALGAAPTAAPAAIPVAVGAPAAAVSFY